MFKITSLRQNHKVHMHTMTNTWIKTTTSSSRKSEHPFLYLENWIKQTLNNCTTFVTTVAAITNIGANKKVHFGQLPH